LPAIIAIVFAPLKPNHLSYPAHLLIPSSGSETGTSHSDQQAIPAAWQLEHQGLNTRRASSYLSRSNSRRIRVQAILIIDHGSVRKEANDMLTDVAALLRTVVDGDVIVEHAHMELAAPTIEEGVNACVAAGAT